MWPIRARVCWVELQQKRGGGECNKRIRFLEPRGNQVTDDLPGGSTCARQLQPDRPTGGRFDSETEKGTASAFYVHEFRKFGHSTRNRLEAEADAVGKVATFRGFFRDTLHQVLSFFELLLA
jgi:hypothetical protein